MAQKTSPYLEVNYGWNLGESGWNTGMDENLVKFSYLFDANVNQIVDTLPSSPLNGTSYYLTSDKRIYFVVGSTYYSTKIPNNFEFYVNNKKYIFDGNSPVQIVSNVDVSSIVSDFNSRINKNSSDISNVSSSLSLKIDASSGVFYGNPQAPSISNSNDSSSIVNSLSLNNILGSKSTIVVDNVAQAITLDRSRYKFVQTLGYYTPGDGGGKLFYVDLADSSSQSNGGTILGTGTGRLKGVNNSKITTAEFGARRDGNTDDTLAVTRWFNYGISNKSEMIISQGIHRITSALTWDFAPVATTGIRIRGESSPNSCTLNFDNTIATTPFQWIGSNSTALFYQVFENFHIITNYNGVGFRIGKEDYSDAFNSCTFNNIIVNNGFKSQQNVACQLNYVLQSLVKIVCNAGGSGRPDAGNGEGYGVPMQIRQAQFCHFIPAAGNGRSGINLNSGYVYGNTFTGIDIEEVNYSVLIEGANVSNNTFLNGTILGLNNVTATAGNNNVFDNVHFALYSGGSQNGSLTGVVYKFPQKSTVTTPAIPASGSSVTNNTGSNVFINMAGGSVSAVTINNFDGGSSSIPIGTWYSASFFLKPGDRITPTYSANFAWTWRLA